MPRPIVLYVRWVERISRFFGRIAMYLVFVMIGVLLYSAVMRTGFNRPPLWSVEMSQFLLVAYFILGGAWTLQLDSHVRMDLLYARWTPRKRAFADTITSVCLITYLVVMLWGGVSSTGYALEYGQRAATSWRPLHGADQAHHDLRHLPDAAADRRLLLPRPRARARGRAIE